MSRKIIFEGTTPGRIVGLCFSLASFVGQTYLTYRLKKTLDEKRAEAKKKGKHYPFLLKFAVFGAMIVGTIYSLYSVLTNSVFLGGGAFNFRLCWGRVFLFFGNKAFLYLFFVERVNHTLHNSDHEMSSTTVWMFRVGIILWNGNSIILGILAVRGAQSCIYPSYWVLQAVLCDLVFSISSVMLFVCGLRSLALAIESTAETSVEKSTPASSAHRMTQKLMQICVKQIILATTAITATWLLSAMFGAILTDMVSTFNMIDVFVNTWCIYASFSFNSDVFLAVCGCWNRCCVRCCFGFYHVTVNEKYFRRGKLDLSARNSELTTASERSSRTTPTTLTITSPS